MSLSNTTTLLHDNEIMLLMELPYNNTITLLQWNYVDNEIMLPCNNRTVLKSSYIMLQKGGFTLLMELHYDNGMQLR